MSSPRETNYVVANYQVQDKGALKLERGKTF